MCHAFFTDAKFYRFLFHIDQEIAAEVQAGNCPHCGGPLHVSRYPRKPRGIRQAVLGESYQSRLSFCCANEDCRRRCTPPSVRFLGRKVYLGVVVVLVTALNHGLTPCRCRQLIEQLDLWPQTIDRWRRWWREVFAVSRCWQIERGHFIPPIDSDQLPGILLDRLNGVDLRYRICLLLRLLAPVTTASWSGSLRVAIDPQKM